MLHSTSTIKNNCFFCSGDAAMLTECDTFYTNKAANGQCSYKKIANRDLESYKNGSSYISLSAMLNDYLQHPNTLFKD